MLTKAALKTNHLSLYLEDQQGLLFNHSNACLYSLPTLSVFTLLLIDDGQSQEQVLENLRKKTDLHHTQLLDFYTDIKDMLTLTPTALKYADGQYPELNVVTPNNKKVHAKNSTQTFQVADASFLILAEPDLLPDITSLLSPIQKPLTSVDFELQIKQEAQGYTIYSNEILVEECESYLEVMPLLIDRLQVLAFQKSEYRFCFHGAALATPKGNILLPGESGAGKSTLSALLLDKVYQLYSDEFIALNDKFEIASIPLPIAIKSGSWEVVSEKYPQLTSAKIWHRLDGRHLKYLWPTTFAEYLPVSSLNTILIHPQYSDMVPKAEITELSIIDTLTLLTTSGYQLGFELHAEKLDELIDFIQQTKKVGIKYSNSEQITEVLRTLT